MMLSKRYALIGALLLLIIFGILGWLVYEVQTIRYMAANLPALQAKVEGDGKTLFEVVQFLNQSIERNKLPQ